MSLFKAYPSNEGTLIALTFSDKASTSDLSALFSILSTAALAASAATFASAAAVFASVAVFFASSTATFASAISFSTSAKAAFTSESPFKLSFCNSPFQQKNHSSVSEV